MTVTEQPDTCDYCAKVVGFHGCPTHGTDCYIRTLEAITLHNDGTVTTTLGTPANIHNSDDTDTMLRKLYTAPILITDLHTINAALQPDGYDFGPVHIEATPNGLMRNTMHGHTWVYHLHPAVLTWDAFPMPPGEGWYILTWVD